jgi:tRNA threonylcarbamoyladenosine biosynthesis protein TsaE
MDTSIPIVTKSAKETAEVGEKIGSVLRESKSPGGEGNIFCLYGQLGSGKTTFVQGLAKGLGIEHRLLSPTFIIVRRYSIGKTFQYLYHIDLYRIDEQKGLEGLGLSEILSEQQSVVVIEWAEKLGDLLPKRRTDITFFRVSDNSHSIRVVHQI